MATAHLSHGLLGAGKTTFARQLERSIPAIRLLARRIEDAPSTAMIHL